MSILASITKSCQKDSGINTLIRYKKGNKEDGNKARQPLDGEHNKIASKPEFRLPVMVCTTVSLFAFMKVIWRNTWNIMYVNCS